MPLSFMDGNEAVARGALASGCEFFAGYPITPATTIFNHMLNLLPPRGGICLQGEDEIASLGFCLGASMAGMKVMTATSGPGISLCSEQISFAIGSEIPIVIVDVQRLGPSTGSATLGADGDIQFLRWGNSGGLPVVVLSPVDVSDCLILTAEAFNIAERYRCPVFIASSKEVGMTRESIDLADLPMPPVEKRRRPLSGKNYMPFGVSKNEDVPPFLPVGGKTVVRQTSSTHGPGGYITNNPVEIAETRLRLARKLRPAGDRHPIFEIHSVENSHTLIITYGATARAAHQALSQLEIEGRPVSLLVLKTLWPVPRDLIRMQTKGKKRVVVVEMNLGQYVREVKRLIPHKTVDFLGQMNGRLITPDQIVEAVADG